MINTETIWNRNFILLSVGNLLMAVSFYFLLPTLPIFIVDVLKENKSNVGIALAVYTLSALIIRPITGKLLDTFGRKLIYLVGFAVFAFSFGLYAVAGSFALLLSLRFFHGFSWGVTSTGSSTVLIDIIPSSKRGEGIGIYGLSMTIAMALGPVIAQSLLKYTCFENMFLIAMLLAILGFVLVLFIKYPSFVPPPKQNSKLISGKIIDRKTAPVASLQLLFGISYGAVISYITLYQQELHLQDRGLFYIILAAGISLSRIIAGKTFDKKGPSLILSLGFLLTSIGLFILSKADNQLFLYSSAALIGLGSGVMMPTLQAMANNMADKYNRGSANATIITAFDLGIGGGSILVGIMSDYLSISFSYFFCSILMIAALILFRTVILSYYNKNVLEIK